MDKPDTVYVPAPGRTLKAPLVAQEYPAPAAHVLGLFGVGTCTFLAAGRKWTAPVPHLARAQASVLEWRKKNGDSRWDGEGGPKDWWCSVAAAELSVPAWVVGLSLPYKRTLYPAVGLAPVTIVLAGGTITTFVSVAPAVLGAIASGREPYTLTDFAGLRLQPYYEGAQGPPDAIQWLTKMVGVRWLRFTQPDVWVLAVEPHLTESLQKLGLVPRAALLGET